MIPQSVGNNAQTHKRVCMVRSDLQNLLILFSGLPVFCCFGMDIPLSDMGFRSDSGRLSDLSCFFTPGTRLKKGGRIIFPAVGIVMALCSPSEYEMIRIC